MDDGVSLPGVPFFTLGDGSGYDLREWGRSGEGARW